MSNQKSFSALNNLHWDEFKAKLGKVEGEFEVKELFSKKIALILNSIDSELNAELSDVTLTECSCECMYKLSEKFINNAKFKELTTTSDINSIIKRYAEASIHKIKHLGNASKETNIKKLQH